jgi:hypothetical protein
MGECDGMILHSSYRGSFWEPYLLLREGETTRLILYFDPVLEDYEEWEVSKDRTSPELAAVWDERCREPR